MLHLSNNVVQVWLIACLVAVSLASQCSELPRVSMVAVIKIAEPMHEQGRSEEDSSWTIVWGGELGASDGQNLCCQGDVVFFVL